MNIRKHQELMDFWEYSHNFDSEDGAFSIDEDITFEASQQELQIELEHFNEMDLEQELHPIKDDDFQPEDEHPYKTMLKRELRAIALKRLEDGARTVSDFEEVIREWDHLDDNKERKERYHEIGRENIDSKKDVAPLAIVIPAPINHAYWRQLMKGDYIDIISNCPYEMHNSLSDEDYFKIIYDLKDDHKELIYFLYLRDFTTNQLAALRNQSDRNIRGVRSTILGQIEKKVLTILVDRQGETFPFTSGNFTMEELDFLTRHAEEIPVTMEKLDKEKLALLKEIGVVVRRIAREQEMLAKEESKKRKKNNRKDRKKKFKNAYRHAMIVIVFIQKGITMKNIFQKSSSNWVKYDKYEWRTATNGKCYITPSADAKPSIYNPIKDYEKLVLTAINIGTAAMNKASEPELKEAIMNFVNEYGMLGLITALPTTPDFITYEAVYLPKNHFIKEESISTEKYLSYFFPFDKIDFRKKGMESSWSTDSVEMIALIMTMKNKPQAVMMSFQKEYAEPYEWLVEVFRDWAFTFFSSFLYYLDHDRLDENERNLYRQGMAAFGGVAPTYRIELRERPTIVWDFNSLLLCVQMMFSFMLTDENSSMKVCKHCGKAFVATRPNVEFCSPQCKNQYNVYKSRAKKNDTPT